ncbi:hypothetical protein MKW92_052213 [Papaver armeniacum]|nr:hypothetical protein MKW92_052213 [Papaver armeniacum]
MLKLSGSFEDSNNKRRFLRRSKSSKEAEKPYQTYTQEKSSKCKISTLKLVLLIIICRTFLTLLHSPTVSHNEQDSRQKLIWWTFRKVSLFNFNESVIGRWREEVPTAKHVILHLDVAGKDVTYGYLYPEWIDEEEYSDVPVCPSLPRPKNYKNSDIDHIAVKLPCRKSAHNWSRDVAHRPVPVFFVTDCFPLANIFNCKELVIREGNAWLYNPKLDTLNQKLQLPVGSCELSLPVKAKDGILRNPTHREAYAMILHSAHAYVCGAIAAAQSIRMVGSTRDFVILVDDTISEYHRSGLAAAGWKIRTIERIRNPKAEENAYNEWNYSKFRLWQLTDYDKIISIDADLLILRNIDFLFGIPEITAAGNNATLSHSGVMVIKPSNCTFQLLMDHINEIESYNGGDQGYLNEIFTWWHRIPKHMNFLKHFWEGDEEEKKFASDVAYKTWWKVHDAMPENLQKFSEKGNYTDRHWNVTVTDERLKTCFKDFCFGGSLLWH